MKKIFCIFAAVIGCFIFVSCGVRGADVSEYAVPEYADGIRMDIGACFGPPVADYHGYSADKFNQARFDEMAAAGFNTLFPGGWLNGTQGDGYNMARCAQMLDYAEKAGIGVWLGDFNLCNYRYGNIKITADFDKYIAHPAVLGNLLCDEPSVSDFDDLTVLYNEYKKHSGGKKGFINLYPSYADAAKTGANYENYAGGFMGAVQPDMLSYDHYPLFKDERSDGAVIVRDSYFTDMETIRHTAKKYGVPVHNYIQAVEHLAYPVLTEKAFRWQIAADQAFGITSFTYFTYWTPDVTGYDNALVKLDGTLTPQYGFAKTVNSEVLAWDHVYLRYEWQGTAAVNGSDGDPYGLLFALKHAKYPDGIEGISSIKSDGDLLCGIFADADGNKGFMLTNASNPYKEKSASVSVRFDKPYKGVQVFEKGVPRIIKLDNRGGAVIGLEPGEGKFIIPLKKK